MQNIRNIAIIAHVDHGKTTLVDKMLLAGNLFRGNQTSGELILDNNDLERERGITILSKNVSINYNGTKINIIDTPGHSDFGGEVERVLNMADGCILLVDAFEGPMPQTRFVLQKALEIGLKPIVVINKVDKPNCRPDEVHEMVFDLMFSLDATEEQLDFPTIYGSAKNNWMSTDWKEQTDSIVPLLDCIVENIPAPEQLEGTPQMLITSLDYSSYTGRIAVGRVHRGTLKEGMNVSLAKRDGSIVKSKIKEVHVFEGLGRVKTTEVSSGDICALVGIDGFEIGDTICDYENPEALPPIAIDEPTMSMLFAINDSPFFGKDGKFVTSRHIHDRLMKELDKNLALRVRKSEEDGKWIVSGRGVLHLSVLIETMRREGYELQVGQPQVIFKEIDGVKCEPIEELTINVPEEYSSKITAISEAVELAMQTPNCKYVLGSVLNHVMLHQTVIGLEAEKQMEMAGEYPDVVIACFGGGSNFSGIAFPFLRHKLTQGKNIRILAAEPASCPKLTRGQFQYDFGDEAGYTPLLPMFTLGHNFAPANIHAGGLRYHGAGSIVSQLKKDGLMDAVDIQQLETFKAATLFAQSEGIIPAPESSHAIAAAIREAEQAKIEGKPRTILFNLSGHGLIDMAAYDQYLAGDLTNYEVTDADVEKNLSEIEKIIK